MGNFNNLAFLILFIGLFVAVMVAIMRHSLNNQKKEMRETSNLYREGVQIVRNFVYNPAIPKPINGHYLLSILTPALDIDSALEAIAEGVDGKKNLITWEIMIDDTEE